MELGNRVYEVIERSEAALPCSMKEGKGVYKS